MPDTKDAVYFLLGDSGEKVSNDPRFHEAEYMEKYLAQTDNIGTATQNDNAVAEQLGTGSPASPMTGQQVAPPSTPVRITGIDVQADEDEDEDVDMDAEDEPDDGLDDMTGKQLKAEVTRLREEDDTEVDTSGVTKKSELVERIRAAKAAKAAGDDNDA